MEDKNVIQIFGEDFNCFKEDDFWFIEHPKWSLVGAGETIQEAHRDLFDSIKITKETFCEFPDDTLSEEAKKMKCWLMPLMPITFTKE